MARRIEDECDVLAFIGEGNFGQVYRVRWRRTGEQLAAKILKRPSDAARFLREIRMATRSNGHPSIMPVVFADLEAVPPYFLMPLAQGSLTSWAGRMNPLQTLFAMQRLMEALAWIHADGGIHRDVKPDNMLLMPDGTSRISDFGLANNPNLTMNFTQTARGTLAYMAPELFDGGDHTFASDVFSAGATWYHLVTGAAPKVKQALPLSTERDSWMGSWIAAMTQVDPDRRPTAAEVASALQARSMELSRAQPTQTPEPTSSDPLETLLKAGLAIGGVYLVARLINS